MITDVKEKKDRRIPVLIACLIIALAFAVCAVAGCAIYGDKPDSPTVLHAQNGETISRLSNGERTIADVVEQVADSVVEITCTVETSSTDWFGRPVTSRGTSAGSGVIIADNGTVITNHHVIDGAVEISVRLRNGNTYAAELVGSDSGHDIAIIKISPEVVIGNPLGTLGGTVTDGIISALERDMTIEGVTMKLLQTNASINSGNSGGGMFDLDGRLIGIVNAKSKGLGVEGLGFAIPSDTALAVAQTIIGE